MPTLLRKGVRRGFNDKSLLYPVGVEFECRYCGALLRTNRKDKKTAVFDQQALRHTSCQGWWVKCPDCQEEVFVPSSDQEDKYQRFLGVTKKLLKNL